MILQFFTHNCIYPLPCDAESRVAMPSTFFVKNQNLVKFSVTLCKFLAGWNTHSLFHDWQCLMIDCKECFHLKIQKAISQSVSQFDGLSLTGMIQMYENNLMIVFTKKIGSGSFQKNFLSFSLCPCPCPPDQTRSWIALAMMIDLIINRIDDDDGGKDCLLSDHHQCKSYFMTIRAFIHDRRLSPPVQWFSSSLCL